MKIQELQERNARVDNLTYCYLWEFISRKFKGVFHGSHGDKLWLFFDWRLR